MTQRVRCPQEKVPLREPHVELLGLPVGDYVVRVRCRSQNSGLWSKWSPTLTMSIPARPPAGASACREGALWISSDRRFIGF